MIIDPVHNLWRSLKISGDTMAAFLVIFARLSRRNEIHYENTFYILLQVSYV